MKKFSFVLFLAVVLTGSSKVVAQSSSLGSTPCANQPTLGRPVLKLRKQKPDDQPTQEPSNAELSKPQPCNNSALAEDAVKIESVGLTNP